METTTMTRAKRLTWRTIVLPLLFIALHLVVSTIVTAAYGLIYAVIQMASGGPGILDFLQDIEQLNDVIMTHFPVIASLVAVVLIPICLVFLRLSAKSDPRILLTGKLRTTDLFASLAMIVGSLGLINLYFNLLYSWGETTPWLRQLLDDYEATSGAFTADIGYFWLILGISILTPALEELIFRGIVQGELRKAMPEWAAVIIQAVLFAAYHMQPVQSSYVLLPGLLLGLAYAWSGSIWVPIVMHSLFNFMGSALPMLIGDSELGNNILGVAETGFILVGLMAGIYMLLKHRAAPKAAVVQSADRTL